MSLLIERLRRFFRLGAHDLLGLNFQARFVPALDVDVTHASIYGEQAIRKHADRITRHLAEFVSARGTAQRPTEGREKPACHFVLRAICLPTLATACESLHSSALSLSYCQVAGEQFSRQEDVVRASGLPGPHQPSRNALRRRAIPVLFRS